MQQHSLTAKRNNAKLQQEIEVGEKLEALDRVIDAVTRDFSRRALNARLKALARKSPNAATICDHILAD